jgi:hypothetical protein
LEIPTPIAIAIGAGVGAVVSAILTGIYNLVTKRAEYANEYYKMVLNKRIGAYEQLEHLIAALKTSVLDTDQKPYHFLFSQEDRLKCAYVLLMNITEHALWLTDEAFEKAQQLNYRMYRTNFEGSAIEFGKDNYQPIAMLREQIESRVAEDMRDLHKVRRFLRRKAKRKAPGIAELSVTDAGLQRTNRTNRR